MSTPSNISNRLAYAVRALHQLADLNRSERIRRMQRVIDLGEPHACEHCAQSFFGFNANARFCSNVCRALGSRQSRRPPAETPEDCRLNQLDALEMKRWGGQDPTWRLRARIVHDQDATDVDDVDPTANTHPFVPSRFAYRCVACGARGEIADCDCVVTCWDVKARDFVDHSPRPAPRRLLPILDDYLTKKYTPPLESCPPATAYDPAWEAARVGEGPREIRARQEPTDRPGKRGRFDVRVSWQKCRIQTGAEREHDNAYATEDWSLPEHQRRRPPTSSSERWSFSDEPWMLDVPELCSTRVLLTAAEMFALPAHVLEKLEGLPIASDNHDNHERQENAHRDPDPVRDARRPTPSLRRATRTARRPHRVRDADAAGDA